MYAEFKLAYLAYTVPFDDFLFFLAYTRRVRHRLSETKLDAFVVLYEQLYKPYSHKARAESKELKSYWDTWEQAHTHLSLTLTEGKLNNNVFNIVEKLEDSLPALQQWRVQWSHFVSEASKRIMLGETGNNL